MVLISGMLAGEMFVATLVVARDPRHQILVVPTGDISDELFGTATAQRCRNSSVMRDDDVTVLPTRPFKAFGPCHPGSLSDQHSIVPTRSR